MKTKKDPNASKLSLKALERAAFVSAYAGANSACGFIFHDIKKPENLKQLKKF